ncbi:HTTM domain-containing protein [Prochlorococcus sp. MIT 1307]|uniref:HTTM domain-containing protein n=1 Tax=Prochlorococcus sp. MIT 1307 TaxID=3096219 RepID=UPI002A75C738|nr:HTTM domain-containing protein [Prochlorococcus sp. MIT 1307]
MNHLTLHSMMRSFERKASTRSSAILRLGLVALVWSCFAKEMIIYRTFQQLDWFLIGTAYFIFSGMLFVGWRTKLANIGLALILNTMVLYLGVYHNHAPFRSHHANLLAMVITWLCFLPSGRSYSLDRLLSLRHAKREGKSPPKELGPVWGLKLLMAQVTILYFFTALDKSYLAYGERLEQVFQTAYFGSHLPWEGLRIVILIMAWTTVLLEYLLVIGLYIRRWHWWLMPMGVSLHILMYLLLPVGTFSLTMIFLYLAFFDPDSVHHYL